MSDIRVCPNCGAVVEEHELFCQNCGTKLPKEQPKVKESNPIEDLDRGVSYEVPVPPTVDPAVSEEYKPIGAWGYIGWNILFAIPLIGFILQLVFSFGGTKNKNLRNYARSFLLVILLTIIITIVLIIVGIATGVLSQMIDFIAENLSMYM